MASQLSDVLSGLGSEQFDESEAPDLSEPTPSTSSIGIRSKKRPRTSKIWDYTPGSHNDSFVNSIGKAVWRCKFCRKEYLETTGSKAVMLHLESAHSITIQSMQVIKTLSRQASITEAFQHTSGHKRRNLAADTGTLDGSLIEVLYIRWITACGIAFRMVEIEEFRTLLLYLNLAIDNYLPSSHTTIQLWTIRTYTAEKVRIQQRVQSALSKVHFTVDLWSSPNSLAIIGVIGHYILDIGSL